MDKRRRGWATTRRVVPEDGVLGLVALATVLIALATVVLALL